jgi:hypothetical protein
MQRACFVHAGTQTFDTHSIGNWNHRMNRLRIVCDDLSVSTQSAFDDARQSIRSVCTRHLEPSSNALACRHACTANCLNLWRLANRVKMRDARANLHRMR